jgi:hypothetical protein
MSAAKKQRDHGVRIDVKAGDALEFDADLLVLKYSGSLHGVDRAVVNAMKMAGHDIRDRLPGEGASFTTRSRKGVVAEHLLFLGVRRLYDLGYEDIRTFGRRALETAATADIAVRHLALTLHGPGFGLDEREAFDSEIAGVLDAISHGNIPSGLKQVTIIEKDDKRAARLTERLQTLLDGDSQPAPERGGTTRMPARLRSVGFDSQSKPHVFVAMPFAAKMDDIFHYGINNAVNAAGFLCERADLSTFTGDVIDWVKKRISTASLVIADLSDANPNVYLEVGYAWGCSRPTVLIVQNTTELKFDVRGQRCLEYKSIRDLETKLRAELVGLGGR